MLLRRRPFTALMLALVVFPAVLAAQSGLRIDIAPDAPKGVYEPGATAIWTLKVSGEQAPAQGTFTWQVKKGGLETIARGAGEWKDGVATLTGTRPDPGVLLLEVIHRPPGADKDTITRGAAVFAPEKIAVSAPPPDDFDAFWQAKIAELHAVPMDAQLEAVDVGDANIEYFKITLNNIRGRKIHGQIAKPKGKTDLPALLQVQWAGVYPLNRDWVLGHARGGWLAMNIMAHDLPIDAPEAFYKEKASKELDDYPGIGADDREQSYFLPMFLSCRRAADYLTQREDWNRRALVVHGGSQGGYQAIVAAGLHPAVTAIAANVPAGCDHTGKLAGRAPGWPNWTGRTWKKMDAGKLQETGRYFDAMNFAPRVKVPALIGIGLIDTVCPAEGIFATVNQLKGPAQLILTPRSGHGGEGPGHRDYYAVFGKFLELAKQGPPAP